MPADYTQLDPLTDYLSLRKKQKEEQAALEAEQAAIDTPEQQNRSTVGRGLADLVRSLGAASNEYGRAGTGDKLMASTEGAYDSGKQDALKTFMDKRKKLATDKQAGMEDISTQISLAKFGKEMTPEAAKMAEWKESKVDGRYYRTGKDGQPEYATDEVAMRLAAEKKKAEQKSTDQPISRTEASAIFAQIKKVKAAEGGFEHINSVDDVMKEGITRGIIKDRNSIYGRFGTQGASTLAGEEVFTRPKYQATQDPTDYLAALPKEAAGLVFKITDEAKKDADSLNEEAAKLQNTSDLLQMA